MGEKLKIGFDVLIVIVAILLFFLVLRKAPAIDKPERVPEPGDEWLPEPVEDDSPAEMPESGHLLVINDLPEDEVLDSLTNDNFPLRLGSSGMRVRVVQEWLNMEADLLIETKYRNISAGGIQITGTWDDATEKLAQQVRNWIVPVIFYTDEDRAYSLSGDPITPTLQADVAGCVFIDEIFYNYYVSKMKKFD